MRYLAADSGNAAEGGLIVLAVILLYFLPGIVASYRHSDKAASVWVIDLFLGWTLLGWVAALALAVSGKRGQS